MFAKWSTYVTSTVTWERNIPLMRRQNTDTAWNGMMLQANVSCYAMTLRCYPSILIRDDLTLQCYVTCL